VFALQCAQLFGPSRILAVDMVPERLARAEALGAEPVDASDGSTIARVLEATGGRGAPAVIEAVGSDQTMNDALFCAAPGGTVSVIGVNSASRSRRSRRRGRRSSRWCRAVVSIPKRCSRTTWACRRRRTRTASSTRAKTAS
jgi:threonine dehydrogenase-like Zn-dependent dehydrogenase